MVKGGLQILIVNGLDCKSKLAENTNQQRKASAVLQTALSYYKHL